MIKIRLAERGTKNKAFYRIVAIDERKQKGAEALEILGYWQPSVNLIKIDNKKVDEWVKKGAQISPAVKKLIKK